MAPCWRLAKQSHAGRDSVRAGLLWLCGVSWLSSAFVWTTLKGDLTTMAVPSSVAMHEEYKANLIWLLHQSPMRGENEITSSTSHSVLRLLGLHRKTGKSSGLVHRERSCEPGAWWHIGFPVPPASAAMEYVEDSSTGRLVGRASVQCKAREISREPHEPYVVLERQVSSSGHHGVFEASDDTHLGVAVR